MRTKKKPMLEKLQTVAERPVNELVQIAIRSAKGLHQLGAEVASSAAPVIQGEAEVVPSLRALSVTLKELAESLTIRSELVNVTVKGMSDTMKGSGQAMQSIGDEIVKQLEAVDVQLKIEKQFSRYLT
jgi:hypothetical protein